MSNDNFYSENSYDMLKCIWMASNVVEYKLCDKMFDCENCQFDKVMRNYTGDVESQVATTQDVVNIIRRKLESIKYDDKFIYLKNCFVVKEVLPNTYYLGVNPIFISFLDNVAIIMECSQGRNILKGQPVVQFFGEWGTISLIAPMNFLIYDKVNNPSDDLAKSKWIAIIGAIPQEVSASSINKSGWEKLYIKSIKSIEDVKSAYPKVGPTMQDGGNHIKYLHQLIGKEKFISILNSLSS